MSLKFWQFKAVFLLLFISSHGGEFLNRRLVIGSIEFPKPSTRSYLRTEQSKYLAEHVTERSSFIGDVIYQESSLKTDEIGEPKKFFVRSSIKKRYENIPSYGNIGRKHYQHILRFGKQSNTQENQIAERERMGSKSNIFRESEIGNRVNTQAREDKRVKILARKKEDFENHSRSTSQERTNERSILIYVGERNDLALTFGRKANRRLNEHRYENKDRRRFNFYEENADFTIVRLSNRRDKELTKSKINRNKIYINPIILPKQSSTLRISNFNNRNQNSMNMHPELKHKRFENTLRKHDEEYDKLFSNRRSSKIIQQIRRTKSENIISTTNRFNDISSVETSESNDENKRQTNRKTMFRTINRNKRVGKQCYGENNHQNHLLVTDEINDNTQRIIVTDLRREYKSNLGMQNTQRNLGGRYQNWNVQTRTLLRLGNKENYSKADDMKRNLQRAKQNEYRHVDRMTTEIYQNPTTITVHNHPQRQINKRKLTSQNTRSLLFSKSLEIILKSFDNCYTKQMLIHLGQGIMLAILVLKSIVENSSEKRNLSSAYVMRQAALFGLK